MRGTRHVRLMPALMLIVSFPALIDAAEVVSTMRNVNAVMEARGFYITPAYESAGREIVGDYAPAQAFEIIRPDNRPVTIGRLYTSCTCVQLEAPKRTFGAGERAVLELRNVRATPAQGQIYAIYIQITSPIRTTLRYDTFVQSNSQPFTAESIMAAAAPKPAAEPVAEPAVEPDAAKPVAEPSDEPVAEPVAEPAVEPDVAKPVAEPADEPVAEPVAESAVEPDAAEPTDVPVAELTAEPAAEPDAARPAAESTDEPAAESTIEADAESAAESAAEPAAEADAEPSAADKMEAKAEKQEPEIIIPEEIEKEMERVAKAEKEIAKEMAEVLAAAKNGKAEMVDGKPVQTISLITLGVRDLTKSINFYKGLGWSPAAGDRYEHAAFLMKNGQVLALHPMESMLEDRNMASASPAPGGVSLAIYVNSRDEVDVIYDIFIKAGATSLRSPAEAPNKSYSAYAADPDGNPWEITHEPRFVIDSDGEIVSQL